MFASNVRTVVKINDVGLLVKCFTTIFGGV